MLKQKNNTHLLIEVREIVHELLDHILEVSIHINVHDVSFLQCFEKGIDNFYCRP